MTVSDPIRTERRARAKQATRAAILEAARRVATDEGARNLSLRGVAAEAGFAPAALYGYFASKDELLLALAADDLSSLARTIRSHRQGLSAAIGASLAQLQHMETMAAVAGALPSSPGSSEPERHFNGRLIATLNALSEASGKRAQSREEQRDVMLLAATLTGLAVLSRTGRLAALGFSSDELLRQLEQRFR